jgi:hypothetical protein
LTTAITLAGATLFRISERLCAKAAKSTSIQAGLEGSGIFAAFWQEDF